MTGLNYFDEHVKYYLAKKDNKFIGITRIYFYDLDNAWSAWYGVLKEYRNKELGRKLLRKTIDFAVTMGFRYMRLYTDYMDNCNAIILYDKEGFIGENSILKN